MTNLCYIIQHQTPLLYFVAIPIHRLSGLKSRIEKGLTHVKKAAPIHYVHTSAASQIQLLQLVTSIYQGEEAVT
jgi:hypothetical protein